MWWGEWSLATDVCAMWLGGWVCGYLWVQGGMPKGLRKWWLRQKAKKLEKHGSKEAFVAFLEKSVADDVAAVAVRA